MRSRLVQDRDLADVAGAAGHGAELLAHLGPVAAYAWRCTLTPTGSQTATPRSKDRWSSDLGLWRSCWSCLRS